MPSVTPRASRIAAALTTLALACGMALVTAAPAQAVPIVDVDNTSNALGVGSGSQPGYGYGQSFTAGITGDLTSVTFTTHIASDASTPAQLLAMSSGALTSTVIATGAITTKTATTLTYTFSAAAPVVEGTMYAIILGPANSIKINSNTYSEGRVYADTGAGLTPAGFDLIFTTSVEPLAPNPATGLTATASPHAVDLDWAAPATGGSVRSYLVEYRASGSPTWQTSGTVTTTDTQVTGLTVSTPYDFRVTSVGVAALSAPVSTSATPLAWPAPGPVSALVATPSVNGANLTWTAPSTGGPLVNYLVQYRVTGTTTWLTSASVTTPARTVTGLSGGTPYEFQVTAVGPDASSTPVTTSATPITPAPGAVTSLVATPQDNAVALSWTAPSTGGPVATYLVEYRATGTATWLTSASVTTTTAQVTGLTGGTPYDLRVTAVGPDLSSSPVATSATPTIPAPGAVGALTATPEDNAVALAWSAPATGGPLADYLVEYRVSGAAGWQAFGSVTTTSAQITGLVGGTAYEFQVTAVGPDASSAPAAASATPTIPAPGTVTALTATPGVGFVDLAWTAPTTGGPVLTYLVEYRVAGAMTWQNQGSVTTTTARITGLNGGTSYEFRVIAVGPDASSTAAALSAIPTIAAVAPAALAAAGTDSGTLTVIAALLLLLGAAAVTVATRRATTAR